jgi:hypothetical protein
MRECQMEDVLEKKIEVDEDELLKVHDAEVLEKELQEWILAMLLPLLKAI